ncbi:MAG: hypothetical protein HY696_09220 [Deltaproteobacteria bacterium]|nr:hypothetical protein [Deltaproteobacteria bacterium]
MSATYLKCRNPVMTYMDPENHFKIPRGRIVPCEGRLTKTMQKWIRRGGLAVVDEAQYLAQTRADPSIKAEPVKEPQPDPVPETMGTPEGKTRVPDPADGKAPETEEAKVKSKKTKNKPGGTT